VGATTQSKAAGAQSKAAGAARKATIVRKTKETDIRIELALDGSGQYDVATGIPFFDHMLESFARHGLFDLSIAAKGDVEVDLHHTVEDVGIALGEAIRQALGSATGITRFGAAVLPMAEAKVEVAVDVSNRPYLVYRVKTAGNRIGDSDPALTVDFLQALSQNAGLDLHVDLRYGRSPHHSVEAVF
jgi:imidazoleglycerol-phosphate dehydratase